MGQLDPVQVDAGLPQVVSVFANSIDGFSKRDQERTPVSDLAERDELFDVELERLALSPVNLYSERLDFDDSEFRSIWPGTSTRRSGFALSRIPPRTMGCPRLSISPASEYGQ